MKTITITITKTITKTIFNENDNEVLRFASCAVPLRPGRLTAPLLVNSYISDKPITVCRGGGILDVAEVRLLPVDRLGKELMMVLALSNFGKRCILAYNFWIAMADSSPS